MTDSRGGAAKGSQRGGQYRIPVECVPDPVVSGCGHFLVDIEVDGNVVRAALDTGVPRTLLFDVPSSAALVGTRRTSGAFGVGEVAEWEVGEIRLGSLRAGPVTVHHISRGRERHPVVGLDVLGQGSWQLAPGSRTLVTHVPFLGGSTLRSAANGHLLTEMRWSDGVASALWDTGAGITLIDRRFAAAHPHLFQPAGVAKATDITGANSEVELANVPGYEIEGVPFVGHLVAITDLPAVPEPIDAAIGFPTIVQARWTVDLRARRWHIERRLAQ
ncbi:MAG TPA: hypothetical protein VG899_08020 [Mycobacteriales bacterium]|nr:hypothetical protein [Mycobacteriales bacterium]